MLVVRWLPRIFSMKLPTRIPFPLPLLTLAAVTLLNGGCLSLPTMDTEGAAETAGEQGSGYVFYLDAMGGAAAAGNWSGSILKGLTDGGYEGTGELYAWEKGSGLQANEDTSVAYKRKRADELTWDIEDKLEELPGAPVDLIGYGAGATVVVFALEALPESVQVENVVLLGPTLAEDYDLTNALKRVKGSITVFTTADGRGNGAAAAGFVVPDGASGQTRSAYADKMLVVPATTAFEKGGRVELDFVRDQVAPYLMGGGGSLFGVFENADYDASDYDAGDYDASGYDGSALFDDLPAPPVE